MQHPRNSNMNLKALLANEFVVLALDALLHVASVTGQGKSLSVSIKASFTFYALRELKKVRF